jgi:hypothetical protein
VYDKRAIVGFLLCCTLAAPFAVRLFSQQAIVANEGDAKVAQSLGAVVLRAAKSYEEKTGKKAKTIVIHINGNLADLEGTAPTKPGINQSHVIFEVEVR